MSRDIVNMVIVILVFSSCSFDRSSTCKQLDSSEIEIGHQFSKDTLYIHLQEGFKQDSISIYIDNVNIINKIVSSDRALGLAYRFKCPLRWLESQIKIIKYDMDENVECKILIERMDFFNKKDTLNFVEVNNVRGNFTYSLRCSMVYYD